MKLITLEIEHVRIAREFGSTPNMNTEFIPLRVDAQNLGHHKVGDVMWSCLLEIAVAGASAPYRWVGIPDW